MARQRSRLLVRDHVLLEEAFPPDGCGGDAGPACFGGLIRRGRTDGQSTKAGRRQLAHPRPLPRAPVVQHQRTIRCRTRIAARRTRSRRASASRARSASAPDRNTGRQPIAATYADGDAVPVRRISLGDSEVGPPITGRWWPARHSPSQERPVGHLFPQCGIGDLAELSADRRQLQYAAGLVDRGVGGGVPDECRPAVHPTAFRHRRVRGRGDRVARGPDRRCLRC